jgi:hypothetical protein
MFGNVQQNFDEEFVKYEERQKIIDEILEWNKWHLFNVSNLNDLREEGYTHHEGTIYVRGCSNYNESLINTLNRLRGEYKTSDVGE